MSVRIREHKLSYPISFSFFSLYSQMDIKAYTDR
nr:MAG TPA: hypothetical protein [Caudoviricetes sp.]